MEEAFAAEVLFVIVAHHQRLHPRSESNSQLPMRLAVCKLHTHDPRLSYPGSRVWDIDISKKMDRPEYKAFPVEAALLREVFACRVLANATCRVEVDMIVVKRKKSGRGCGKKVSIAIPRGGCTIETSFAE